MDLRSGLTLVVCVLAFVLQGCGTGGGSPSPAPPAGHTTTPAPEKSTTHTAHGATTSPHNTTPAPHNTSTAAKPTTVEATTTKPGPPTVPPPPTPPLGSSIRGMCYAPLPCTGPQNCGAPEDMAQPIYKRLWDSSGRDDLGIMKRMGVNAIRLYHPIGYEQGAQPDHGAILDAAHAQGFNVFAAVHQYLPCDAQDDCFDSWNKAVEGGLAAGFARNGSWHPSVWAINMINEVDAIVPFTAATRQVKRLISAIDGLLAAEKKANVTDRTNLTSCFTTAIAKPLGNDPASVYHGFSSIEAWIKDPSLVDYSPRSANLTSFVAEVNKRWVHCVNAQIPWKNGLKEMIADHYSGFLPRPWIIGEMGFNGVHTDVIQQELEDMHAYAGSGSGFAGSFFFQFQTAYWKTGAELNYGVFGFGEKELPWTISTNGKTFPIHCLTSRLFAFEQPWSGCKEECNHRAKAVAKAFGGNISGTGLCVNATPLAPAAAIQVALVI